MIPPLNEIIGLPPASSIADIGLATERCFQNALDRAIHGDTQAQRELLHLRVAYLNWAYAGRQLACRPTHEGAATYLTAPSAQGA